MLTKSELIKQGFNFILLPKGKIKCEHEITGKTIIGSLLTIRKKLSYED